MQDLSNIQVIRALLSARGFHFSKAFGQNFLINPSVCPRMAHEAVRTPDMGVLEIGPGIGVLTRELAKSARKVVAVELDKRLLPILSETLEDFDNVRVINGDILKLDLHALLSEEFPGMTVSVCANLPYYITSPILMLLLESRLPLESIVVMVQKEAADRICAPVGTREAGAVTAVVRYYCEPSRLFSVSRGSFLPAPKVDSAVIRLVIQKTPPVTVSDEKAFFRLIHAAFEQRRKTALNAVSAGLCLPKERVAAALSEAGLPPMIRGEQMDLSDFALLCEKLLH